MCEPSSSCRTARSLICGAACCCGASASRTARDGAVRSRSVVWSRWPICIWVRWNLSLTADNWSAGVTVRSAIDGRIVNAGAKLYRKFNNKHLEPLTGKCRRQDGVYLQMRTSQSTYSCRAGGANPAVHRRTATGCPAPAHRGTWIHRTGTRCRTSNEAKHWCWKSWPLSIPLAITQFRSADWRRASR